MSLPSIRFNEIKTFRDFTILLDGMVLDSELTEHVRRKYYKLCRNQNTFLHGKLIKGLNLKLIVGIISEMVNIADALKACGLTTPREEFAAWDKALKASKLYGMNVCFLRQHLTRLVNLAFDSEDAKKARRYIEARTEREQTEKERKKLEARLEELKAARERFGADIESLKSKTEIYEHKFQEEVPAPW